MSNQVKIGLLSIESCQSKGHKLQNRVDQILWETLRNRDTTSNHGHLIIPDYNVPGYTGILRPTFIKTDFSGQQPCSVISNIVVRSIEDHGNHTADNKNE